MKPNNEKKIILIGLVTFVICVIFGTGFIISKAIYDKLINYDPSIKIQADAILTMEELGYNEIYKVNLIEGEKLKKLKLSEFLFYKFNFRLCHAINFML